MLILGAQLLLGFQLRSFFEKGFETLPIPTQFMQLVALGAILAALALLIAPTAYHVLSSEGRTPGDPRLHDACDDVRASSVGAHVGLELPTWWRRRSPGLPWGP